MIIIFLFISILTYRIPTLYQLTPHHIKKAIPHSQALRYRRIIDNDEVLDSELDRLKDKFINRGYPSHEINQQIDRVLSVNRVDTLKYKTAQQKRKSFVDLPEMDLFYLLLSPFVKNMSMVTTTFIKC